MDLTGLLKGHSKQETTERYMVLGVVFGVFLAGIGTAMTVFGTKGAPAAVALVGSFITFAFTVVLVFYWVFRGDK